ncbi:hypothetical protein T440DRAFT_292760 [Plenodomus tracheiphilus IPT5]|uniref:Uncharacterized protein n=1 Tax=Plenodomus tracheiphilus IPT5 TaxID=1408161 RepID=A0A6A7BEG9_9PLEO|nr:hypothetical protein T440DRAFT_292760 [Plenodomus tracheiphilus IPT5]
MYRYNFNATINQQVRWCSWLSRQSNIPLEFLNTEGPEFKPRLNHYLYWFPLGVRFSLLFCSCGSLGRGEGGEGVADVKKVAARAVRNMILLHRRIFLLE